MQLNGYPLIKQSRTPCKVTILNIKAKNWNRSKCSSHTRKMWLKNYKGLQANTGLQQSLQKQKN